MKGFPLSNNKDKDNANHHHHHQNHNSTNNKLCPTSETNCTYKHFSELIYFVETSLGHPTIGHKIQ